MGVAMSGPIPKRDNQKAGHNSKAESEEITRIKMIGSVPVPELIKFEGMIRHPLVENFYQSLQESGQSQFYEPSDWQTAQLCMYLLNAQLLADRPSPTMIAAIWQMLGSLCVTEGERRRMRIEVDRETGEQASAEVIPISKVYADRLAAMPASQA